MSPNDEPTTNIHPHCFSCVQTFESSDITRLWQSLSYGLNSNLWRGKHKFFDIHTEKFAFNTPLSTTLQTHLQGITYTLEGTLTAEKKPDGMVWHGDFSHEKDGLVRFILSLSLVKRGEKERNSAREESDYILKMYEVRLLLDIFDQKGRIALLDPRESTPYWQNSLAKLCRQIRRKLQQQILALQEQEENSQKTSIWWFVYIVIGCILTIFFFA